MTYLVRICINQVDNRFKRILMDFNPNLETEMKTKAATGKTKSKVVGYLRVSTKDQTIENQELAIRKFCDKEGLKLDDVIEAKVSSRQSTRKRKIDQLLESLNACDTLIVSELSRLARSVGQIAFMVDTLLKNKVRLIAIKERIDLNGKQDMQSKVMITMFSLFAELERDLISERTKEGLERAKKHGTKLGRPTGSLGTSKLDVHKEQIIELLEKKVSKASIAKIIGCSYTTLFNYVKSRKLG